MIDKGTIQKLAQERIDELDNGCYLVDIRVDAANRICVEVDNESRGIAVDDCVSISRNIEHNLDREVEDFALEVSSPGLDKPFKVWQQYVKSVGKEVVVKSADMPKMQGTILSADEESFVLRVETKERVEGRKKKETVVTDHAFKYNEDIETKIVIVFK